MGALAFLAILACFSEVRVCVYRVFLKILTHLFSVFEGLNVCQGTCSVRETKEGFMEICLTECMLSSIRWYNRTKEKAKTLHFHI